MTLQAPRRIPGSAPRDALTGAPLVAGLPIYRVSLPLKFQRPGYLERDDEAQAVAAPLTLHRRQQEGAVGLAYSVLWGRYLSLVLADVRAEEAREMLAWWRDDYGLRRVVRGLYAELARRHVDARIARDRAEYILTAVLTCHREEADPAAIAARYGKTEQWLLKHIDWCMKLAHGISLHALQPLPDEHQSA